MQKRKDSKARDVLFATIIGQNAILKELHFVHDVRDSSEDFERSLDNGVGTEPGMFDGDPLEGAIGNDHAVGAHQPKQTAMKLVSAAFIVTVHQNDLGPDLVLFPALEMLKTSKPDHVFLEAAPCFSSNALLLCAYGNPTIFAHPVENGGSRKKTVSFRNAFDWLGSENTRSKTAHFIIRNCYRSRDS